MDSHKQEERIILLEQLRNTLTQHATGGSGDNDLFTKSRQELISDPEVSAIMPRWLKSCRNLGDFWGMIKQKFAHYQERRDWLREEFEPIFDFLEGRISNPSDESITDALRKSGGEYVQMTWQKALERREQDPDGAITIARTLLEEVCRFVLDELGEPYDEKADLPKLYGLVAKNLKLAPSQHTEHIVKQILGGCHSVVDGLGTLRSRIGDAHAKGKVGMRAAPRHAALAVNIAGAVASFIIETYEVRRKDSSTGNS